MFVSCDLNDEHRMDQSVEMGAVTEGVRLTYLKVPVA
jgi:hypothetical protein